MSNDNPRLFRCLIAFQLVFAISFFKFEDSVAEQLTTTVYQSNSKHIQVTRQTPRYFGYSAGDVIRHRFKITIPPGATLNTSRLPKTGTVSDWLEVIDAQLDQQSDRHYTLRVQYQVAKSVKTTELLKIPAFQISTGNAPEADSLTVPAWEFSYHTIIPTRISDSELIAQPAQAPEKLPVRAVVARMLLALLTAIICMGYLLWRAGKLRLWSSKTTPFQTSLQALKQLPANAASAEQIEQAYRLVHTAFNQIAGQTVLESKLDCFFEQHPELNVLKSEAETFFRRSRQLFYETNTILELQSRDSNTLKMLRQLCLRFDRRLKQR